MAERPRTGYPDDEIDLGAYLGIFRRIWWKTALASLLVGAATLAGMYRLPNNYQSTAVIAPAVDEKKQSPAWGALASFGIEIGGPSKVEDLEILFRSKSLTVRVFGKYDLWPAAYPKEFDSKSGKLKTGWVDRLLGEKGESREPTSWDAIRAADDRYGVSVNRKTGTLSISFEATTPQGSADIVKHYLEEGKSRLQEEALERAGRNKRFIEEQIARTVDPLTRDRLFALFGQEVEREMLARNRDQFAFQVVDPPIVPDRKSGPHRLRTAFLAALVSMIVLSGGGIAMGKSRAGDDRSENA